MAEADVDEMDRFEGYNEKNHPSFTELCRRFYCGLWDHGCVEECRKMDKNKQHFLCEICDMDEKECKLKTRKFIHGKYFERGKITADLNDDNQFRDKVEMEYAHLKRDLKALKTKYNTCTDKSTKKRTWKEIEETTYGIGLLEEMLEYVYEEEDENVIDEITSADLPSIKNKKNIRKAKKIDPIGEGKDALTIFRKNLWYIIIGVIIAYYIYVM